eukprot:743239-Pyramimonas_sp.AAC.1
MIATLEQTGSWNWRREQQHSPSQPGGPTRGLADIYIYADIDCAPDLCAVLHATTNGGHHLLWVNLVLEDLRVFQKQVLSSSLFLLSDPADDPNK